MRNIVRGFIVAAAMSAAVAPASAKAWDIWDLFRDLSHHHHHDNDGGSHHTAPAPLTEIGLGLGAGGLALSGLLSRKRQR
jgi:hypothetical protein